MEETVSFVLCLVSHGGLKECPEPPRFFRVVVHTVVERVLDERELEALGPAHDPKAALMRNKVMERAPLAEVVKDAWLVYYTDEE